MITPVKLIDNVRLAVDGAEVDGTQDDVADALIVAGKMLLVAGLRGLDEAKREFHLKALETNVRQHFALSVEAEMQRAASPYPKPNGKMNGHGHG